MAEIAIAGWFASPIIGLVANRACSYVENWHEYHKGVADKLKRLEANLKKIQAIIYAAERKQIDNPHLSDWLRELKYAAYDAEDVLDKFEFQLLRDKASEARGISAHEILKRVTNFFSDVELKELHKIVDRFSLHVNEMGVFLTFLSLDDAKRPMEIIEWRMTTSALPEPKVFGRDKERAEITKMLLETDTSLRYSNKASFSVLPIIGTGGMGKTTLAQWVYNDRTVKQHFHLTAWVCVSERFEPRRLMMEIIESASIERPHDFHNLQNLDHIQEILRRGLEEKRFLIVLDDVWNAVSSNWEILRTAFKSGQDGSRVIVTSRDHIIAEMMGTMPPVALKGLEEEAYWSFFVQCAFGGEDPKDHPKLEPIGRQLIKRLGGLPLAARVIGGALMSSLDEEHWRGILDSKLWHVKQVQDDMWPVLRLSYDHLSAHLKQCFVYCCLFPKDYLFEKDRLVQIWMAQGFVQHSEERKMEDIGRAYFDELSRRSFFERMQYQDEYVIHDMLHDFAESVSNDEYFRIEDNRAIVASPKRLRHLYVGAADNLPVVLKNMYEAKLLRSLVVHGRFDFNDLLHIFEELKGLRALILGEININQLPESVGKLIHLRYLELHKIDIAKLPKSLHRLYHLQGLDVRGCARLLRVPIGPHNLPKLLYFIR